MRVVFTLGNIRPISPGLLLRHFLLLENGEKRGESNFTFSAWMNLNDGSNLEPNCELLISASIPKVTVQHDLCIKVALRKIWGRFEGNSAQSGSQLSGPRWIIQRIKFDFVVFSSFLFLHSSCFFYFTWWTGPFCPSYFQYSGICPFLYLWMWECGIEGSWLCVADFN